MSYERDFLNFPFKFEVVIGDGWNFTNVPFVEDEVIELQMVISECHGTQIVYSEDGTLDDVATNRIYLEYYINDDGTNGLYSYAFVSGSLTGAADFEVVDGDNAYEFDEMFDGGGSLNPSSAAAAIFDILSTFNGGFFKSITATYENLTGTFTPAVSGDDGFSNGVTLDIASGNLKMGNDGSNDCTPFFRFTSVAIPKNAVITRAAIKFTSYATLGNAWNFIGMKVVDVANPDAPLDLTEFNALSLHSTFLTPVGYAANLVDGTKYGSPYADGFAEVIQKLVDKTDWESGNAIVVVYSKVSFPASGHCEFSAFDHASGAEKVELIVDWVTDDFIDQEEEVTVTDAHEAFNFDLWRRRYLHRARSRFEFILTGLNNDTTDVTIPIKSFQARKRSEAPTYLSVVLMYTAERSTAIIARPDGELKIEQVYYVDGVEAVRESILIVDLEEIRNDGGGRNQSITLTGHRTVVYSSKNITLEKSISRRVIDGKIAHRFVAPDLYLNPGDTVTIDDDEYIADVIGYYVNPTQQSMDVIEEE